MIKLIKTIVALSSILGVTIFSSKNQDLNPFYEQDKMDKQFIDNYLFNRDSNDSKDDLTSIYVYKKFGHINDFDISINLIDPDNLILRKSISFTKVGSNKFHYQVLFKTDRDETIVIKEGKDYFNSGLENEKIIPADLKFDFSLVDTYGEVIISCRDDNNALNRSTLSFKLTKPQDVIATSDEYNTYCGASLYNNKFKIKRHSLEIYNLQPSMNEKYYFYLPVSRIYARQVGYRFISCKNAYLYLKDDYGYFEKILPEKDKKFPNYRKIMYASTVFNERNYLTEFYLPQLGYVDRVTHMMSKNEKDFQYGVQTNTLYFPKNKYNYYKEIDAIFYIENIFFDNINLTFNFKIKFDNNYIDNAVLDYRGVPSSDKYYKNFMMEYKI